MSINEMLPYVLVIILSLCLLKIYRKAQQRRAKGEFALEDINQARKYFVLSLQHCIDNGIEIDISQMRQIILDTKEYHPDVSIDYDLVAGSFGVVLKSHGLKRTIYGYTYPPKYELENNMRYVIN